MIRKIVRVLKAPKKIILYLASGRFKWFRLPMSDEKYIKLQYELTMGKKLNLDNPKSFNEKLQWLKINDRNPEYTKMVDKYDVKRYVSEKIGEHYIIPTLGVWERFEDIDFDSLPEKFVLKCTHDSGGLVIVKDKENLNKNEARKKISNSLKTNYYYIGREWPYKSVKPRVIAEKYMEDKLTCELTDYKFMCFGGRVEYIFTCTERFGGNELKVTFFDRDWNVMPFERHYHKSKKKISKPSKLEEMISLAESLSKGIPFVRVDFYEVDGQIYFGELTFYPGNGMEAFTPEIWDKKLGELIKI